MYSPKGNLAGLFQFIRETLLINVGKKFTLISLHIHLFQENAL